MKLKDADIDIFLLKMSIENYDVTPEVEANLDQHDSIVQIDDLTDDAITVLGDNNYGVYKTYDSGYYITFQSSDHTREELKTLIEEVAE